jgi:hypothetical protein
MKDLLVIFITLLLLLTIISSLGGSIRFKESFNNIRPEMNGVDYEPIYKDTIDNVYTKAVMETPRPPPKKAAPLQAPSVMLEPEIVAEPFVVSEEEQMAGGGSEVLGYDSSDVFASF